VSLLCCISYLAVRVVSMEFSEGTDVDDEEDFVEIRDIELPDDDPLQCGSEYCVICNELATEQQPPIFCWYGGGPQSRHLYWPEFCGL